MPSLPTDDRTDRPTAALRRRLERALEHAELDDARTELRQALQLVDAVDADLAGHTGAVAGAADLEPPGDRRDDRAHTGLPVETPGTASAAAGEERGPARDDAHPGAGAGEVPTEPAVIRAAFAEAPHADAVDAETRAIAIASFPPVAVPDDGPIPDPHAQAPTREVTVTVPPWVLATAAYGLVAPGREFTRDRVIGHLLDRVDVRAVFRTPKGADAADAILEAARAIDDPTAAFGERPATEGSL